MTQKMTHMAARASFADPIFDVAIVGGGPAGATAAHDLALRGRTVLLLDRSGRVKPCGGAIPPRLMRDFAIPDDLLVARVHGARVISPRARAIAMPITDGFVGMIDRDVFDEWLRQRAAVAGAVRVTGRFDHITHDADGLARVHYQAGVDGHSGTPAEARARVVIGADGALSAVARQTIPGADRTPFVFAYHEIIRAPEMACRGFDGEICDIYYRGTLSPDFYGWVFPHGRTVSVGTGSARKGFSLRKAVGAIRAEAGLDGAETLRREGAPIPLRPLRRWDNGRNVVLAGDAAGVVAPASGEGIYYAMLGGRLAGEAADAFCASGDPRALRTARQRFMGEHRLVFMILGMMQNYWYANDRRRERFVSICGDADVQRLTWESYMNKALTRADPLAHARIFLKNLAHITGFARA